MTTLLKRLEALSSANEFLAFFEIDYDERVVHVNRLHILKRFYQYLNREEGVNDLPEGEMFGRYRELLAQAYQDFTQSNAATEKVFKVFQDADGQQSVTLSSLKASLDDRRKPAPAIPRGAV